jgi:hypothetical protein
MSFKDLDVDQVPFAGSFLRGEEPGRKRIALSIERLDRSWNLMVKTTMSVVAVTMATVENDDRPVARTVLEGMVGVLSRMTELITYQAIQSEDGQFEVLKVLDHVKEEAERIDKAGQQMFDKVDNLGRSIISDLLTDLPRKWKGHLQMLDEVVLSCHRDLKQEDAKCISILMKDEQVRMTHLFFSMISELLGDSYELNEQKTGYITKFAQAEMLASSWVIAARPVFNDHERILGVSESSVCLSRTIKQLGFPDVYWSLKDE